MTIDKASVPPLDALLRGADPTDANLMLTLTQAEPFSGRGLPAGQRCSASSRSCTWSRRR